MTDLTDRARGALAGVAVGDAIGAPFEGSRRVALADLEAVTAGAAKLRYTDDTAMTIALAEALIADGDLEGARLARVFADTYAAEPWRGYGSGPPQVFRMIDSGVAWDDAPRRLFGGAGSYGNGGAMRVAPVALHSYGDLERTAHLARFSAAVTHAHEIAQDGAALQACMIGAILREPAIDRDRLIDAVRQHLTTTEMAGQLDRIAAIGPDADPERIAATFGNGVAALEAVPAAIASYLARPDGIAEAVPFAVRVGGDTDTIAAMAGAMSGAAHGVSSIPATWRLRVEGVEVLQRLADGLISRSLPDA